jgi:hypothetical protein
VLDYAIAKDKVYQLFLSFRGPKGSKFGERIPISIRINMPDTDTATKMAETIPELPVPQSEAPTKEAEDSSSVSRLARKLHESGFGTIEDIEKFLREQSCDVAQLKNLNDS